MPTTLQAFHSGLSAPLFSGVPSTADVPALMMAAVNGHAYQINTSPQAIDSFGEFFKEQSLPLLRQQADQSETPGEASISPEQFWRRSQDSWHHGAGQSMLDRKDSDRLRYNASKGVDPWTRYQLGLLNDTSSILASANSGLVMVSANAYGYVADGQTLRYTSDLASFTAVTGTPAATLASLATNGQTIWAAYSASGIYSTTAGAASASSYVTGTVTLVGFAKGRLMAANGAALYNPTAAGALPAALFTHADTAFTWVGFAEGPAQIYAAGYAGDRSWVYRTAVQPDGTGLAVPVVAATLPTGERVRSILGYLGYVVIGTDKGVRFAVPDSDGDLTIGALITMSSPVYALEPNDRFVWFGWTNYDATSTGLGRMDLSTISGSLAPAYASDVMATTQGTVRSAITVNSRRLLSVDGVGVFVEGTAPVASGTVTTGQITYGIGDPKVAVFFDLKHAPLPSGTSVSVSLAADRGTATAIGSSASSGSVSPGSPLDCGKQRGEEFEATVTLTASGSSEPTLTRWTLRSYPAPARSSYVWLPILLYDQVLTLVDSPWPMAVRSEYDFLTDIHRTQEIASIQVGTVTWQGVLEEYTWLPEKLAADHLWWQGTFLAKFRLITA